MRTLRKNQSLLKYSNQAAIVPAFETDENGNIKFWSYIDDDGNEFFYEDTDGNKIPIFADSGTETLYNTPENFFASIAMSGGEAESVEYGLSITEYEAVAIVQRGTVPLTEGSLIWFQSEPKYISEEPIHILVNEEEISGMFAKRTSADFFVKKIAPSQHFDKYILGAVNK